MKSDITLNEKHRFRLLGVRSAAYQWTVHSDEMGQALRVLRLKENDIFEICDLEGWVAISQMTHAKKNLFEFRILSETFFPRNDSGPSRYQLAIAVLKPNHMNEMIPLLCELDISELWIFSQEGDPHFLAGDKNLLRWEKIAAESTKQCKRPYSLKIRYYEGLQALVKREESEPKTFVYLDPEASLPLSSLPITNTSPPGHTIVLVVGSERGIAPTELTWLNQQKALSFHLGSNILRSVTAATACAVHMKSSCFLGSTTI